jgi:hypothetical protein
VIELEREEEVKLIADLHFIQLVAIMELHHAII